MKHEDLRDMFKKASKSLYINCCGISLPLVSYLINFFSCRNYDSEPAGEGYIQIAYSSD
jgi:hypothetical protein